MAIMRQCRHKRHRRLGGSRKADILTVYRTGGRSVIAQQPGTRHASPASCVKPLAKLSSYRQAIRCHPLQSSAAEAQKQCEQLTKLSSLSVSMHTSITLTGIFCRAPCRFLDHLHRKTSILIIHIYLQLVIKPQDGSWLSPTFAVLTVRRFIRPWVPLQSPWHIRCTSTH